MKILAIETSCDDTCIAIVKVSKKKPCFNVLANIASSQVKIHQKWGGVYPTLAKREHQKNLVPVLEKALKEAKLTVESRNHNTGFDSLARILAKEEILFKKLKKFLTTYEKPDIDLIAVTCGPGLEPSLWVGVNFAKALANYWNIPVAAINHVEAHLFANWLTSIKSDTKVFPAVCLIVSGGHTQLVLMGKIGKYEILGETRDDAAGECFDKVAKILGLAYPGGPVIAAIAAKAPDRSEIKLPRPMINSQDYDFSFSGLKTAALNLVKKQGKLNNEFIQAVCRETQQAIIDVLIRKTIKAAKDFRVKSIILGGGVTANAELKRQMGERIKKEFNYFVPQPAQATDNALMVAACCYYGKKQPLKSPAKLEAQANLRL